MMIALAIVPGGAEEVGPAEIGTASEAAAGEAAGVAGEAASDLAKTPGGRG